MYTKDYLVSVYLDRFIRCPVITPDQVDNLEKQALLFYDRVGRDTFRKYAGVTPEAIREYEDNL